MASLSGRPGVLRPGVLGATAESYPLFRCPQCRQSGVIDQEQYLGLASIQCECGYHESRDWSHQEA